LLIGLGYALFSKSAYDSEATISPKIRANGLGEANLISQFSGRGQDGVGSLNRIDIIINSQAVAESVIIKENLLPILYADLWDEEINNWFPEIPEDKIPSVPLGAK